MSRLVWLFALAAFLSSATFQDETKPIVRGDLGARLDDYLTRSAAFGFSGSVLVKKGGEIVLSKGYGLADRSAKTPNAPDTIHDIGSLTKQFTATAILLLEQDGKLSISDTLPKFFRDVPADKREIQLHHLLTHTSGLPRGSERVASSLQDRDALVKILFELPLESKPGARHAYSNLGYGLLAVVVEKVSGRTFEEYLSERLFRPAGLSSTGFRGDGRLDAAHAAHGSRGPPEADLSGSKMTGEHENPWEPSLATACWYSWGLRGAGGVLTTILDLERWHRAIGSDSILRAAAREKLFRPFKDNYACGWYVQKTQRGARWIEHGGSTENGFECKMTMFPDEEVLLVVLGNVGGLIVPWVNLNLGKLALGETVEWPPEVHAVDEARLQALAGAYEAPGGARFAIEAHDGALVLSAENAAALSRIAPPLSDRSKDLLSKTEKIAAELRKDRFGLLHAAEWKKHPLFFFDNWWKELAKERGDLREIVVLGGVEDPALGAVSTLLDLRFEHGREILKLAWSDGEITGTTIGPPYLSRVRLVATADERFVCFDLKASHAIAELSANTKAREDPLPLTLVAREKTVTLRQHAPR